MRPSDLDRRVTWLTRHLAADAAGDQREAWGGEGYEVEIWASAPRKATDEQQAAQTDVSWTTRLKIRWRSDVATRDRVVFDGRTYEVADLEEIGRKEGLFVMLVEALDGDRQSG